MYTKYNGLIGEILLYTGDIKINNMEAANKISLVRANSIDIQDSKLGELYINYEYYDNKVNEVKIIGNELDRSIEYYPNNQAIVNIRNNIVKNPVMGDVNLNLKNANGNIINNIEGKIGIKYFSNISDITFPKNEYIIYTRSEVEIPAGKKVVFEAGSVIKLYDNTIITVKGELDLNGTPEEIITLTSKASYSKWQSIDVKSGGILKVSNAVMEKRWNIL